MSPKLYASACTEPSHVISPSRNNKEGRPRPKLRRTSFSEAVSLEEKGSSKTTQSIQGNIFRK